MEFGNLKQKARPSLVYLVLISSAVILMLLFVIGKVEFVFDYWSSKYTLNQ